MPAIDVAVGGGVGINGCIPGCAEAKRAVVQCVLNTTGCVLKTKYPSVPHLNEQLTNDEHELKYTFRSVMYWYVGTPCRGPRGHSENDSRIMSSSVDMVMYFLRAMALMREQ